MNKNGYRVIFSKTLQRWVVVSEFSQGESKATTAFKPFFTPSLSHVAIKPLVFSLYCALGFVVFSDLALANLIIQADTSAPKTQQAIILQTANGLPQVNIQTPNSKGLSHNKYAQFDVDTKGVILNNSHTYVQTQQGGWVQGNPYLARGEAKVILNEVNSSNPSQLKGYVEVAGKKADVIIANPSGIHCAGCGVINSGRTTFTTGNPHIKDGQVDSFTVEKGKVSVSGKGLDNSRVDYTEIIARETEMNAGIWSNKKLTVVTGENTIKRTATSASQNDNDHLKIIHTKPTDNVTQPTEKYAVDVSELGGMYAGKIHLIGTEQGLGVRNAGHIGASVDTLTIDSQGRIVNTGTLNAQKSVQLTSTKGIENRGKIENRRSNIHLSTQADIQQDGSMVARAGNINQQANTQISQQGETVAKGNITYLAPKVTASTSSWIVAGVDIKDSADGEVRSLETASSQGQHIVVTTSGKTTLQGKNLASGKIQVNAAEAHLDNSQTSAYSIHIEAKQGNILADNAILVAEKEIAFRTPTQLQTENSVVKAQKITTKQTALNTKKAVWEQTGTDELKLDVLDTLQNQGGTFKTQGDLRVKANGINNQQGRLIAKGKLTINAAKGKVDSTQGALVSKQDLRVMSGELVNDAGVMQSQQNIAINTPGQNLSNKQTLTEAQDKGIVALGELTLQSQALLNQNGRIIAKGNANIHAEQLKNETGEIRVGQQGKLDAVHLDNQAGTIVSVGGDLSLTTPTILNNQQGYISANNTLSLQTQGVENQQGNIISSNNLVIDSAEHLLNNLKGTLFATHQTEIHAGELNNQYGLIRADNTLVINTNRHALDNRNTQAIQQGIVGGGEVMLKNVTTLLNQQGSLYGENALDITTQVETNNQQGTIQSNGKLSLVTPKLDNRAGDIASYVGNITAQYIDNRAVSNRGSLIYGENLSLVTQQLDNQETKATGDIPTQGIQGERLAIQSASLSNQHGGMYSTDTTSITASQQVNNQQGELLSANAISVKNNGNLMLNNENGLIQAQNAIHLTVKALEKEGTIKTKGDLTVELQDDFTLNHAFAVGNNLTFKTQADFTNNVEQVVGNQATFMANHLINHANAAISSNQTLLNAGTITNYGLLDGRENIIKTGTLDNRGTGRIYGDHVAIQADSLNNLNQGEQSATIAARHRVDFGVGTLTNRDHSLLFSTGDMAIGGQLDENHHAVGYANFVDNGSATIEALGNGDIKTQRLFNHDLYLKLGEYHKDEHIIEYAPLTSSKRYALLNQEGGEGTFEPKNNSRRDSNSYFILKDGTKIASRYWMTWDYNRHTVTTTIAHRDPAKILIGGHLSLAGSDLENKASTLSIGKTLLLGDSMFTRNENNENVTAGDITLKNIDIPGTIDITDTGTWSSFGKERRRYGVRGKKRWAVYSNGSGNLHDIHPTQHFTFDKVLNEIGHDIVGTNTQIEKQPDTNRVTLKSVVTSDLPTKGQSALSIPAVSAVISGHISAIQPENLSHHTLPMIKTLADIRLPQASLYQINPDAPNGYLVETDPQFTKKKNWLSSDYMFNALRYHHDNVHKRLGDGFYEQRLINEQIHQLTGRRYIEGYTNELEQYKALMNSGINYAKAFNLTVGVGLTAKQMAELTTDMVWFVNKEITLQNGKKVTALVPQVYLVARDTDVTPQGAVISANNILGDVGELNNSGVIAGRDLTQIRSHNIENRGVILGDSVDLSAKQHLVNLGGRIEGVNTLNLFAGKHLEIASTLSSAESDNGKLARTQLDQLSTIKVTGNGGALALRSEGNIAIKAAQLESKGTVGITAGDSLQITTLNVHNKENYEGDANNYYHVEQTSEAGSHIMAQDGVALVVQHDVKLRQTDIRSQQGTTRIGSKAGNVVITAGRSAEQLATSTKSTEKGLLSKTTTISRYEHNMTNAKTSNIDGNKVAIIAQQGNVTVSGSNVVADKDLSLFAKENVSILSDKNTYYQNEEITKRKSGVMGSGGIGFTIGSKKEKVEQDRTQESATSSQVGSLNGHTAIQAGNHYQQMGSVVTAVKGDVNILAKSAAITAARSDYESNYKYTMEPKGLTIALTGAVASALQAVDFTVKSAKNIGDSKNNRINAMATANTVFEAARAVEQLQGVAQAVANGSTTGGAVGVSITYGQQKNVQTQHTEGNTIEKSAVNAGGKVNIQATGNGEQSQIDILGADASGQTGTHLKADGKVNIQAVDENHLERSKNKSSGFNVGVAIQFDNSIAAGIIAGGNVAKGYGNGESQAWVTSYVGDKNSQTTIESGNDTNIIGSQVKGKRVNVTAENLNIESLQDTAKYADKQGSVSGQVTVGYGFSAGGSYSRSKVNSNYASVKTQAGIYAGDEGYDVDVSKGVQLTGGVILSQADADKNALSAQDFSFTDITNYSDAKASSSNFMGGLSFGKDQRSDEEKAKDQVYRAKREKNGETFETANPNQANSSPIKFGLGEKDVHSADLYAAAKIGLVNMLGNTEKSQQASSTTSSIISEGHFNIGSAEGREKLNRIKKGNSEQTNSLAQQNYQVLQKKVENDTAIQKSFYKDVAGLTDEAYRTMFIAEHRMMTAVIDKNGNPIKDKNLEKTLNDEAVKIANEKLEKGEITQLEYSKEIENYKLNQLGKGRNIYKLREVSDQERAYIKPVTYTDPLTGKSETKYVVTFNGIFNDENAAAKFAWQNYVAKEGASGKIDTPIYQDVYFVHHPQANNFLSELLVAGYEKMIETSFGNVFGMDNSSLQAKSLMEKYGKEHLFAGAHSRGTLTVTNALNALNTEENREAKLLSGTTIKMVGPAADVTHADEVLSGLQTGKQRESSEGSIRIENHQQDPVGSLPILLGGNPATMDDNSQNRGFIRRTLDMFGDNSSMHNCYGLGQEQCKNDGYRKEGELIMNKEQTIFDLNQNKHSNK